MAKRKSPSFITQKKRRSGRTLRVALAFFVSVVIFATLSFFYMLRTYDYDLSNVLNKREETSGTTQENPQPQAAEGAARFLLALTAPEQDEEALILAALVHADVTQRTIYLCTLSPEQTVQYEAQSLSLKQHWKAGGMQRLSAAVQTQYGFAPDRYIAADSVGLRELVQSLGSVRLTIPERIDYRSQDLTLLLLKGEQILRSDVFLKYLQYQATCGAQGLPAQAEALGALLRQYLTEENTAQGETLFRMIINLVESNVSAYDFVSNLKALRYLSWSKEPFILQIERTPSAFPNDEEKEGAP